MKDIKDYLHLYLGCEVQVNLHLADVVDRYKIGTLIGAYIDQWENGNYHPTVQVDWGYRDNRGYYHLHRVKPILRPLSDMTEEDMKLFAGLRGYSNITFIHHVSNGIEFRHSNCTTYLCWTKFNVEQYLWLLKNSFDIFNLIPEGLAIDATKIGKP